MTRRVDNPFAYSPYPTDPAWGAVASNLATALFGDPEAAAQARVQRAQVEAMNAEAGVNKEKGWRLGFENDKRFTMDRDGVFGNVYAPENTGPMTPPAQMPAVGIGGVPMVVAGNPQGGMIAAPPAATGVAAAASGAPQGGWTWTNPVQGGKLTSGFGPRRAPTAGASSQHGGIDIGGPRSSAVGAAGPGEVIDVGFDGKYGGGNYVKIRHPDGSVTGYAHLDGFNVKRGDPVQAGQRIGTLGATGTTTGPNLHLTYRPNENAGRADPSFIYKGGVRAVPGSGVAAAASGAPSAAGQPIAQIAPPAMIAEPGGARVDPRLMTGLAGQMFLAGYDSNDVVAMGRVAGAYGDDKSMRGSVVLAGGQPGENFAGSREAQLNNMALDRAGGLAEAVVSGNIDQVGGTLRNTQDNVTSRQNNQEDNATSRANNSASNATAIQTARIGAQSRENVAGAKAGERTVRAADSNAMNAAFDAAVPIKEKDQDASSGAMKITVLSTAGELYASGQAGSHTEAVNMALQAHGVNRGPSSRNPNVEVWRWHRDPRGLPTQRVINDAAGVGGRVTVTSW